MLNLSRYEVKNASAWDAFVDQARNSHFFFKRGYMDYHAERFSDHSLILTRDGNIEALFPANVNGNIVYSHQGLTFGGLIVGDQGQAKVCEAIKLIASYYAKNGTHSIIYKCIPHIFHRQPAEEDLYVLHHLGAQLVRRDLSSVISLQNARRYTKGKLENLRRANDVGLKVRRDKDLREFMSLLHETLRSRHNTKPTHTLEEMERLAKVFPENIRLYSVCDEKELLAGALVFVNRSVVHTQYLANSENGRKVGALDLVIDWLMTTEFKTSQWFSFGISTTDEGKNLNLGLLHHKEAFGARGVVHDFYRMDITGIAT